jgi:DNA-binding transcriptional ArsR family regulator
MLRALISPVRQEIIDAVVAAGPCTVAQLGRLLGRAPDSLYFHVKRLESAGLLLEGEASRRGRHVAAVYDVPGRPVLIRFGAGAPDTFRRSVNGVVQSAIRLGARDFAKAIESPGATTKSRPRALWGGRAKGWVSAAELKELNALIARASEILSSGVPRAGRKPVSFTFVLAPARTSARAPRPSVARPVSSKGASS